LSCTTTIAKSRPDAPRPATRELQRLDWALIDISDPQTSPLASYLLGFVPLVRMERAGQPSSEAAASRMKQALFGAFEAER
jgi:hypothetical protein